MEDQFKKVEMEAEEGSLVKKMPSPKSNINFKKSLIPGLVILAIILAGGFSGYVLAQRSMTVPETEKELTGGAKMVQGPKEVGIKDEEVFRDTAQGRIEANDSEKVTEGSHKLLRPGGESQTAFLTSSVLNLDQFQGKCVQVWGETFAGQEAGWLMDVGRVKVLDRCPEGV